MNPILKLISYIFLSGSMGFVSCKKNKQDMPSAFVQPEKATINFHIKNSFVIPADSIYLYRLISTNTSNVYDSTQNIYLRPNIDTTFIYTVGGNTNNVFIVGIPDPDEIPYYIESRHIVAGGNINWQIEY